MFSYFFFFALLLEAGSLTEHGARLGTSNPLSMSRVKGMCVYTWLFTWILRILSQVLMLAQYVFYLLSHLPSPDYVLMGKRSQL